MSRSEAVFTVLAELAGLAAVVSRAEAALTRQVLDDLPAAPRRSTDLRIETIVHELLSEPDGPIAGAGFVSAAGLLSDQRYWLEWWTTPRQSGPARLRVQSDPDAEDFRDYTRLPWFAGPAATGTRSMVGPYVDYLCSDEYMLTFTEPVRLADGTFLGVVGADVRVEWVERALASPLAALGAPALVVNSDNRVVASVATDWLPGDRARGVQEWPRHPSDDLPLFLLFDELGPARSAP